MNGEWREAVVVTLNRSALVVKPRQPFLEWLHAADPKSHRLTLVDLSREPTIYLIPECDTPADVEDVLQDLCEEIFCETIGGLVHRYRDLAGRSRLPGILPVVRLPTSFHAR